MLKPGESIPPFHLVDLDGHVVDKASLHGHTVLINFYFSTCAPCVAEIPVLTAYAREHPHMRVLAVTFDDAKTSRSCVSEHHFSWPVLANGMGFISAMGVNTYPAMALVGPDGRLLRMTISADIGHGQPLTVGALTHWVDRGIARASPMKKR
jgi:thiol-disulfide isomerase/thioredoxin